jgi:hypothetical protein
MVNVEALLSPSGGYDYDSTINSGVAGLVGAFLFDKTIHSSFEKHAVEYFRKNISPRKNLIKQRSEIVGKYKRAVEGIDKIDIKKATKGSDVRKRKAADFRRVRAQRNTELKAVSRKYDPNITKAEKAFTRNLRGSRGLFRGIGITMLLSAGFELIEALATPGISKVAAQKEQQFMTSSGTALDSQGSYTMRQRAVMAIHDSMMNVRQVIGNEAQFMHR